MRWQLIIIVFGLITVRNGFAQSTALTVSGRVVGLQQPLPGAIILLTGGKALQHQVFVVASGQGQFSLAMPVDSFPALLEVKALSWKPFSKRLTADMIGDSLIIVLQPDSATLLPVEIRARQPVKVRGDTTVFDVKSFATTAEQQVADLLKRLPGFELDRQGNIRFKGKPVERVLLNGADLAGADYQQLIQRLSARGIEEVEAIENYTDDDDELAALAGAQRLAINLKYADSVAAKVQGRLSALAGLPARTAAAEMQALQLGSSTKWLGIAGYSSGTEQLNAGALGSVPSPTGSGPWASGRAEPLVRQWPQPSPMPGVAMLTQPRAGYLQLGWVGGKSEGWRWRSQVQWMHDKAGQQTSELSKILLPDTVVTQTNSANQQWQQGRLAAFWRGNGRLPGGSQLLLEANLAKASLQSQSAFQFLQVAGTDAQRQQQWEGQVRMVLNKKRDTTPTHRTELLLSNQWISDRFELVSPDIIKAILSDSATSSTLAQQQRWLGWRAEVKHRLVLPKARRWRLEGRAWLLNRRQQVDWLKQAPQLLLATGNSTLAQAELHVGYRVWARGSSRLTAQLQLQAGQLRQAAAASRQHLPFWLLLPSLEGQFRWKGWNLNANLGWQNATFEWPASLPGSALVGRTMLQQGTLAQGPRPAFTGNASLSRLQVAGNRPSLFFNLFHQQTPLFVLPDFLPGLSINRFQYLLFDGHRSISSASVRVASPLARQKLAYEVFWQLNLIAGYNRPLGQVQKVETALNQLTTKLVWRPANAFQAGITNTLGLQQQRVAGRLGGEVLTHLAEAAMQWQTNKTLQIEIMAGHFLNRGGNSAASMLFCKAQAIIKLGRWSLLPQVYNPFNETGLSTVRVGDGLVATSAVNALPRYVAMGVRYAW